MSRTTRTRCAPVAECGAILRPAPARVVSDPDDRLAGALCGGLECDGIGDPDKRPPRRELAWNGLESNDMGIDDFMTFCRLLGAEPYIAVNTGLAKIFRTGEIVQIYSKYFSDIGFHPSGWLGAVFTFGGLPD